MVRRARIATLIAVALMLGGCALVTGPVLPAVFAALKVQIVLPLTAVLDGRESRGQRFDWDLGDGTLIENGSKIVSHEYPVEARYVVILTVRSGDLAPAAAGGVPGPGPIVPGEAGVDSTYVVVDLLGDMPQAVIIVFNQYGKPTGDVYAYLPLVLYGEASSDPAGSGLWYLWEVVRVDSATLEPIPYPPHTDGYQPPIEYIRSQDMNWTLYPRGPGGCSLIPWTYRIRLIVGDAWGRQHETVKYVKVW